MDYDVVIVGGGAAGLSAALVLARARRRVLVVDDSRPRNAPAGHVHNYLGREGTPPSELLEIGRAEITGYGAEIRLGTVTGAEALPGGHQVLVDDEPVRARRLLLATGLVDELPPVPGLAERWGRDVLHCPYCHGYEVRDRAIGVLATSAAAVDQALLWRQWSADVLVLAGAVTFSADQRRRLAARGIRAVDGEVAELDISGDRLRGVRLTGGELIAREAIVVAPRFLARSAVARSLGLATVEHPFGEYVPADEHGATAIPGVRVAGNLADLRGQVLTSAAAGSQAAAAINAELVEDDTERALAAAESPPHSNARSLTACSARAGTACQNHPQRKGSGNDG